MWEIGLLMYNLRQRLFLGKLKLKWSGPFTGTHEFTNGAKEVEVKEGPSFNISTKHLKLYHWDF